MKGLASIYTILILAICSQNSFALNYNKMGSGFFNLTCTYTYETEESFDVKRGEFSVFGIKDTESVNFNVRKRNLPSYFFKFTGGFPASVWHRDAEFLFRARLRGEELIYSFQYLNYKRDKSKLHILRREDRRINLDGLFDDNHAKFNFEDGKKIFFSIDESDWIQESITSIEDCEVQIF